MYAPNPAPAAPRASRATQLLRITGLVLHLVRGLLTAAFVFPLQSPQGRKNAIRRWSARLLRILAVRLHVHGSVEPARPLMFVANHVSWLDIFAVDAVAPARFVAKSEIRDWPLLGWLCARAGTLFIDRARRRDTARLNQEASAALIAGDLFAVFPEGTTTDGSCVLKFHSSLLAPGLAANAAVQPVAIRYARTDGSVCREAAYDGDKSFWDTVLAMTAQPAIEARVAFLPALREAPRGRRELAHRVREVIVWTLFPEAPRSRTEEADDPRA